MGTKRTKHFSFGIRQERRGGMIQYHIDKCISYHVSARGYIWIIEVSE